MVTNPLSWLEETTGALIWTAKPAHAHAHTTHMQYAFNKKIKILFYATWQQIRVFFYMYSSSVVNEIRL
jgi:hypothetical protein